MIHFPGPRAWTVPCNDLRNDCTYQIGQFHQRDEMKANKMSGICSAQGGVKKHVQDFNCKACSEEKTQKI
jgi:putative hemolysin